MILELTSDEVEVFIKRGVKNVPENGNCSESEGSLETRGAWQGIQCLWRVQSGNEVGKSSKTRSVGGPCWPRYRGIMSLS